MVACNGVCSRFMNPPAKENQAYVPTKVEQIGNCLTHGIFIFPSIAFLYKMVSVATSRIHLATAIVYGIALVLLFFISTAFHVISLTGRFKKLRSILHLGDRFMIYLFIAASYMPWLVLQDFGVSMEYMIWSIWIAAVSGIFYSFVFHEKYKMLETLLYLCLGTLPSLKLIQHESKGLLELAIGGALYIVGIFFFKSDGRIPFAHAIWHVLGAGGACFHLLGTWIHFFSALQ